MNLNLFFSKSFDRFCFTNPFNYLKKTKFKNCKNHLSKFLYVMFQKFDSLVNCKSFMPRESFVTDLK